METAHELFVHGLSDILDGERQLVDALEKLSEQASRPELRKAFDSHRKQTEKQVQRLEQVFKSLGEEPQDTECKGIKGLVEEHETFVEEEEPSPDIADIESVIGAAKVEAYEINEYEGLIRLAREMDHSKAEKLLKQNLKEEQDTLKKMQGFSKKLKAKKMGMEGEERSRRVA
jgi:ferritin-like metal-binding protein YciE